MKEITKFDQDLLGLEGFGHRLTSFLLVERQFVENGLVVALNSPFGTGKSTFIRMWQNQIDSSENPDFFTIRLNAWESDYLSDPLLSIVSELIEAYQEESEALNKVKNASKDLGWFALGVGNQIVKKFTGVDVVTAGDLAEKKKNTGQDSSLIELDCFSVYQQRKKAVFQLKSAISGFIKEQKKPVVFIVDELDRCRPDYAVSYLETIKHVFDLPDSIFLLAVDKHHLENSAKTEFGRDLDFEEYFRKFVHREASLPKIVKYNYERLIKEYIELYANVGEIRGSLVNFADNGTYVLLSFFVELSLTPRQVKEVFRTLGHLTECNLKQKGQFYVNLSLGCLLMCTLKIAAPSFYKTLGTTVIDEPAIVYDFLQNKMPSSNIERWFGILVTGGVFGDLDYEEIREKLHTKAPENFIEIAMDHKALTSQSFGWDHYSDKRFQSIYERIEELQQWN